MSDSERDTAEDINVWFAAAETEARALLLRSLSIDGRNCEALFDAMTRIRQTASPASEQQERDLNAWLATRPEGLHYDELINSLLGSHQEAAYYLGLAMGTKIGGAR